MGSAIRKTFFAPSPLAVNFLWQLAAGAMFLGAFAALEHADAIDVATLSPLCFIAYLVAYLLPRRVVTGADGFRVAWLGPGRFIPYSRVVRASADDVGVDVLLRGGDRISVPFQRQFRWGLDLVVVLFANQKPKIVERIQQGVEAHAALPADRDMGGLLARQGRTPSQWLEALRALGSPDAQEYRAASMAPDLLWRIAENVAAPPEERAAAAVALKTTLDDAGRVRLRSLATETAAPKVRVALEAAAGSEDPEELARALADCEELSARGQ